MSARESDLKPGAVFILTDPRFPDFADDVKDVVVYQGGRFRYLDTGIIAMGGAHPALDDLEPLVPGHDDEHADILAELAETQAALHAATNDVVRLAAELHTAHGQIDRARALADKWSISRGGIRGFCADDLLAALDGDAS